ncbi:MAG: amino acid ABC transporter ATP-binding/permease protein [Lachnospiraceae bacterium]
MKKRSGFEVMAELIRLVKSLTGFMVLAILMGLIGHLCAAGITVLGGYGVLELLGFQVPFSLKAVFTTAVLFAVIRGFLRYGEQACNHYIAFKLLALIRDKVFGALRKLCPAKLEGKEKGNLISVITSDIELLEVFYAHTISPSVIAFIFTMVMCLFIGRYHFLQGITALTAYIAVGILVPLITSRVSGETGMRFRTKFGALSSFVLDSLRGLPEIQQYGQGEDRIAVMNTMTEELSVDEKRMKHISGRNMAVTNTVILAADLGMLFVSALLMRQGLTDFEGVLIPTLALMSSFGPVVALANLGSTLQNTFAAGNRVLDILEERPITEEIQGKKDISFGGAKAENVTFAYGDEIILNHTSMTVPKGRIVGIAGKSGSGKSTLLRLFMRFWQVNEGRVWISDTDIEEINTENLRNMESYMTQETHLFHDSIKNNLRLVKPEATDGEIIDACKKASIHNFIMSLPQGYDTPVGELGETLSGGEKQRLGLARSFLHDAPFVLLDEPTSNLDSLNEAVILKSLREEGKGKTVVMVSHRQSALRVADTVCSMEELSGTGRVS